MTSTNVSFRAEREIPFPAICFYPSLERDIDILPKLSYSLDILGNVSVSLSRVRNDTYTK